MDLISFLYGILSIYLVLPEQRLTQVTKAIMADAKPNIYGYLLEAPQQQQQQQQQQSRENIYGIPQGNN